MGKNGIDFIKFSLVDHDHSILTPKVFLMKSWIILVFQIFLSHRLMLLDCLRSESSISIICKQIEINKSNNNKKHVHSHTGSHLFEFVFIYWHLGIHNIWSLIQCRNIESVFLNFYWIKHSSRHRFAFIVLFQQHLAITQIIVIFLFFSLKKDSCTRVILKYHLNNYENIHARRFNIQTFSSKKKHQEILIHIQFDVVVSSQQH